MSACAQVIIHSGMLSLIDDRSVLMFKVVQVGKSHCVVLQTGESWQAGPTPRIETHPTGSPSHTRAEITGWSVHAPAQICSPAVQETARRY